MSYTVLARRYRSTTFEDVVGQEPIARTLQNAIKSDRTAHAYLFSGTRGVGKTSMARIFARELNMSPELKEVTAIGNAILRGEDLDVIEIDGASNRGVQEARDLIAASGLAPTRCRYRIYIIDEVHMLTTPAFNALLKTMEEPPSHVKFILCTTEPHKVPATIQSRCQRFDFRAISSSKIASHLAFILQQEGVEAEPEVIAEVARLGNGSMRDALSILDRLLAGGATKIALHEMEDLLGLPSQTAIYSLCDAISRSDMKEAFESADILIASGISLDRVLEVVAMSLRFALIAKVCGEESPLLELSDESRAQASCIGAKFSEATFSYMIALCDATSRQVRRGGTGRALFDATIARLCMTDELVQAGNVLVGSDTAKTQVKKKRLTKTSASSTFPVVSQLAVGLTPVTTVTKSLSWESLHKVIASTAGLKLIASHLAFVSLHEDRLVLKIKESGLDSTNYILAQRKAIADALSDFASRRISVDITTENDKIRTKMQTPNLDSVEGHELVQAARGLFDGTVVKVVNNTKEGS